MLLWLISPFVMHVVLCLNWAPDLNGVFYFYSFLYLFLFAFSSLVKESLWVLLLFATIITGVVVVETFPFVWTPPVSSRCHFAFHPHPLVRISAALLAGCLLVSIAHCGLWFAMSFVPAVTPQPIAWCSLALLHKKILTFSPIFQSNG